MGKQPARRAAGAGADGRRRAVLSGVSRSAVLETLRAAQAPLSVADVAARVGLHLNTVRRHLDRLTEAGQADRTTESRRSPGRPRRLYTARAGAGGPASGGEPESGYRLLAGILAGYLAGVSPDPAAAAGRAGRAWGGYLIGKPPPFTRFGPEEAAELLTRLLDDLGFAPEPGPAGGGAITLHACPFREVAEHHPDVACGVHLGLMQGALAELGTPASTVRLEPFTTPRTCQAHIGTEPVPGEGDAHQ